MNSHVRFGLVLLFLVAAAATASAQIDCPSSACLTASTGQTYRIVYQTVYEQRQYTAYRIEYETVCEQRQVTSYKPVWETAVRENRYTVAKPVLETSEREETYTVQRPVYETSERQEVYTVQRPVYETAEREETYTVMKPVYETSYRTECRTVYQPVTTCQTRYVDQGCYADQMVLKPSWPSSKLTWQSGGCAVDPVTGQTTYQKAGLYWAQTQHGKYEVQKVWQPNIVPQQYQQTAYVPQTVSQQIPVQVCKMVPEQVVRKIPYQVCRMVTEQQVRKVPVTTCRMVTEQCVRKVPVTTCKMVYEERVEQVPYQVCRMVAQQQTVSVPRCVEKRIPVNYTCNVPKLVCYRIPLDACGNPINGTSTTTSSPAQPQQPTPAKKPAAADVKPELGSDAATPRPVETEEKQPSKDLGPMKAVPPPTKSPAPSSLVYPKNP